MSNKRGAEFQIIKDGIGSMDGQDGPTATKATAAQLANRKILAGKRRGRAGTPGASSGFASSTGGFNAAPSQSQSFPPIIPNGAAPATNGGLSTSFGGFGNGGGGGVGGGFSFNAAPSGGFNNPFASQSSAQESTNVGGFGFGGGGQPQAANTPFSFGQQPVQPPATNMFGASASQPSTAFGGFGASQAQPAINMFGASTAQPAQSAAPAFNFGASVPASTASTSNMFGSTFGATPPSQPSAPSFGGFGQSGATNTVATAPSFGNAFGQSALVSAHQNGDSAMKTTPENSPQKPAWNKSTANGLAVGETTNGGSSSPDRPPHIEQEGEAPPNPFAGIKRPPPQSLLSPAVETPKPASSNLFSFGKPAEPAKSVEPEKKPAQEKEFKQPASSNLFNFGQSVEVTKEAIPAVSSNNLFSFGKPAEAAKEAAKVTTPAASSNPFAAIKRMPTTELSSKPTSLFASTPQAEQSKPASTPSFFGITPAAKPAVSRATPSTLFQPKASLSNFFSRDEAPSAVEAPSTAPVVTAKPLNLFAQSFAPSKESPQPQQATQTPQTSTSRPNSMFSTPTPNSQPTSHVVKATAPAQPTPVELALARSDLFNTFRPEIMREDNLPAPDAQQDLNAEEKKLYYRDLKLARLNKVWLQVLPTLAQYGNLSAFMGDYAALHAEISESTKNSRLGSLISTQGQAAGQRTYDQEVGRLPIAESSNKRRAAPAESEDEETPRPKRTNMNGFGNTASPTKNMCGAAPTPATTSKTTFFGAPASASGASNGTNLFPKPAEQGTSSSSSTVNKFASILGGGETNGTSSGTKNMFTSSTSGSAPSSLFAGNASTNGSALSLFSKPVEATPPSTFGSGFKPTNSSNTNDVAKPPSFGGFKPSLSSGTSAGLSLPKFGGSSSGSFMTQFAQSAEETAKKAKQAAMDNDYDSDDETKEAWSARYDRELAEKKKKMASAAAGTSFKFTPTSSVAGSNVGSDGEGEISRGGSNYLALPKSSSLYPDLSRSTSPTGSATGSVFDAPRAGTPGAISKDNPFASLGSRPASEIGHSEKGDNADDEEETDGDDDASVVHVATDVREDEDATPKANGVQKRGAPFVDDEDSQTDTPVKQRTDGLFGRVSKDGNRTPLISTGANAKPFFSTSSAGDQTWTPKDPIKFTSNNATSSDGETAKKPLFNFGTTNNSSAPKPSLFSAGTPFSFGTPADKLKDASKLAPPSTGGSVFSSPGWSRATTPGPSDMSGAESTAAEGEEETKSEAQLDIADLAEDKEGADVIFEASKVKATKYEVADAATDKKAGWNVIGVGPIAVLNKGGVVTVLMRATPSGRVVINSRVGAIINPEAMKKRARFHLLSAEGKPESHLISFLTEQDCSAFVEASKANGAK